MDFLLKKKKSPVPETHFVAVMPVANKEKAISTHFSDLFTISKVTSFSWKKISNLNQDVTQKGASGTMVRA